MRRKGGATASDAAPRVGVCLLLYFFDRYRSSHRGELEVDERETSCSTVTTTATSSTT